MAVADIGYVADNVQENGGVEVVGVLFPAVKNTVHWDKRAFEPAHTTSTIIATHRGAVRDILQLKLGRVATAGDDGSIKIIDWNSESLQYVPAFDLGDIHTDLVKCIRPMRLPDVFVSCSYDGTVREWHVYDSPAAARCVRCLHVPCCDGSLSPSPSSAAGSMGIVCMDSYPSAAAVFCCGLVRGNHSHVQVDVGRHMRAAPGLGI